MALMRVKKQDIQHRPAPPLHGIDICLACWRDYMHTDDRDLGASRTRLGSRNGEEEACGYESDPYFEQRKADLRIGEATDAMIDSLPRHHVWAIYKANGIGQVWQFPQADFAATLAQALAELEKKLRGNLATRVKFA